VLPSDISADQLAAALQAAAAGLVVLHPTEISRRIHANIAGVAVAGRTPRAADSPRARSPANARAAGLANKEIAARLNISDHTAKFHVAAILGKLGAATRTEAVALASAAASSFSNHFGALD